MAGVGFLNCYHAEIVQAIFAGKFIEHSWLLPMIMGFAMINTISEPTALVHLLIGAAVFGLVGLLHVRSAAISSSDRAILAAVTVGTPALVLQYLGLLSRAKKPPAAS